jgi:hypothetical protein
MIAAFSATVEGAGSLSEKFFRRLEAAIELGEGRV